MNFAVVASEVRKHTEKSQSSAKEISELAIGRMKISERAGEFPGKMIPSAKKTADLVQNITEASEQ